MAKDPNFDYSQVEIETTSDDLLDVKAQLNGEVEVEDEEKPAEEEAAEEEPEEEKPAKGKEAKGKKPAAAEEEEPAEEEPAEEEAESEEEEPKPKPKVKPEPKDVQKTVPRARLNEEIQRRKATERELAKLKERPEAEGEPEPQSTDESGFVYDKPEPKLEDFLKDIDEFDTKKLLAKNAEYNAKYREWADGKADAKAEFRATQREAQRQYEESMKPFRESEERARAIHDDYDEVTKSSKVDVSQRMITFMYESEVGAEIRYYLAENPKEARRITSIQTNRGQDKAMEELEKTFLDEAETEEPETEEEEKPRVPPKQIPPKGKPKPKVGGAPPPTKPVKPGGPGVRSMQDLAGPADKVGVDIDFDPEYEKAYKAGRRT